MIVAFATNDHNTIVETHFGDAKQYDVYQVDREQVQFIDTVLNTEKSDHHDHKHHQHGNKADRILLALSTYHVEALVNKAFGKNVVVIANHVLPIVIRMDSIEMCITAIQRHFDLIQTELANDMKSFIAISNDAVEATVNRVK